jgi:glycosyltransferase involved in cell wall biosynthesis
MTRPLRVLQVGAADLIGRRFNNFDLVPQLQGYGIESRMVTRIRQSDDPRVRRIFGNSLSQRIQSYQRSLETKFSVQSRFQVQSFLLALHPWFRWADIVHYHIIHDQWFSLDALPLLTRRKPSIWTWHDPWMMTGHCLYPIDCRGWQTGCGNCPDLERPFAMKRDRTREQFAYKRNLLAKLDVDLVVASRHMFDMARASTISTDKRIHLIPFGIDLSVFAPGDEEGARLRLGVEPNRVVIAFREELENPFKGTATLLAAIARLPEDLPPICLLTSHAKGVAQSFVGRHQVIELGWVNDERLMVDFNLAADVVVIPSIAEAFGMMAIEAMACAKPVIVGAGTSLLEVSGAPEIGLPVDGRKPDELAMTITRLTRDALERRSRGLAARRMAEECYDVSRFAGDLAALYKQVGARGSI